jgi:hypothetical protein
MNERYTRKDADRCFQRLLNATGKRRAFAYNDVGGWELDCNATYGGCTVHEISSASGGVFLPFGTSRRPPREFCDTVRFADDAVVLR